MIIRSILTHPDEVLANFDWFNDYEDTRSFIKGVLEKPQENSDVYVIQGRLAHGYEAWLIRRKTKPTEPVKPQFNLPTPVRIGVLKTAKAKYKHADGTIDEHQYTLKHCLGEKAAELVTPAIRNQWTDTGAVGLLLSFHVEGSDDGQIVVGLVELPSGQFETFSASCLKLVEATKY